jgi:hypothetical protein
MLDNNEFRLMFYAREQLVEQGLRNTMYEAGKHFVQALQHNPPMYRFGMTDEQLLMALENDSVMCLGRVCVTYNQHHPYIRIYFMIFSYVSPR